ncbi:MAG: sulfatase-like hydrolase/transferase, partial [bacterium]|nr:sulfatase-like hydrolase/transferase [bacterium]
ADGWRGQALESAGDPNLRAPNLTRLAGQGINLTRAYAANPVCSPSRAAMFTGKFPHMCGVPQNDGRLPATETTLAEVLGEAGYATGYIGKWHLNGSQDPGFVPPGALRQGFRDWAAFNQGHRYFSSGYFRDNDRPISVEGFEPDYQTDLAIDFIRANAARPFCLCVSWGPPHPPRTPPPAYAEIYKPSGIRLRSNVPRSHASRARKSLAGYYGLCTAIDANAGRILDAVDENGLARDTIVVFTSDHGDMLGSHGLDFNGVPFEESVRIPLLIRYPKKIQDGESSRVLMSNVDLMPTLLGLAGLSSPEGIHGLDLSGQLTGQPGAHPEAVYCQGRLGTPPEWRMVIRGLDKVVVNRDLHITDLYNLGQDPYEKRNLARDSKHRRKQDEMLAILRDWMRRMSDKFLPSGLRIRT